MATGATYVGGQTGQIGPVELPADPDLQDVIDALVELGLVTEAE